MNINPKKDHSKRTRYIFKNFLREINNQPQTTERRNMKDNDMKVIDADYDKSHDTNFDRINDVSYLLSKALLILDGVTYYGCNNRYEDKDGLLNAQQSLNNQRREMDDAIQRLMRG